jgi:pilus assembly protein CpaE
VRLLLAPDEGERAEEVDSTVARNVLGAVRARHALTVVDLGSMVSEATAIGAEMASKVLIVATPDVVALRGVRRLRDLWRRLQVRDDDQETLVVLNQASRKREVQPDLARKVVGGRLANTTIPADFAAFEAAVNTGSPARLEEQKLRGAFEALAAEIEAIPVAEEETGGDGEPRGLLARLSGERGQASVEFAGLLPLLFVILLLLWQIALTGYTFMLAGHAAREGARELATNTTDEPKDRPYVDTAMEDLPKAWRKGAKVDKADQVTVRVKLNVPIVVPMMRSPWKISSEAGTSIEEEPLPPSQSKAGI